MSERARTAMTSYLACKYDNNQMVHLNVSNKGRLSLSATNYPSQNSYTAPYILSWFRFPIAIGVTVHGVRFNSLRVGRHGNRALPVCAGVRCRYPVLPAVYGAVMPYSPGRTWSLQANTTVRQPWTACATGAGRGGQSRTPLPPAAPGWGLGSDGRLPKQETHR